MHLIYCTVLIFNVVAISVAMIEMSFGHQNHSKNYTFLHSQFIFSICIVYAKKKIF